MNAEIFRQLYDYHFSENRKLWDDCLIPLSETQWTQPFPYSNGSIANHIVHLAEVEDIWFSELRGFTEPSHPFSDGITDRDQIRALWDQSEQTIRAYLADLHDDQLLSKPIVMEEDRDLSVWQVLIHVVNHATDHRAQVRRLLYDLGVTTGPQDFIFYAYDHLIR